MWFNHFPSTDRVSEKHSQFVKKHTATEISVAHYTGRIIYDTRAFTDINRDFVPPEMIETFRSSLDESIMLMFTNQLTKAGNLTMPFEAVQHKDESERKSYVSLSQFLLANLNFGYFCKLCISGLEYPKCRMHFPSEQSTYPGGQLPLHLPDPAQNAKPECKSWRALRSLHSRWSGVQAQILPLGCRPATDEGLGSSGHCYCSPEGIQLASAIRRVPKAVGNRFHSSFHLKISKYLKYSY